GMPVVVEVLGEDAEAVAGLLRLAPVGIEDAEAELRPRPRGHEQQDAVRAHAPVSVADLLDLRAAERRGKIRPVDHDVVVAETVSLRERDHRGNTTSTPVWEWRGFGRATG